MNRFELRVSLLLLCPGCFKEKNPVKNVKENKFLKRLKYTNYMRYTFNNKINLHRRHSRSRF